MPMILNFLLRALLVIAGLVFAAGVLVVSLVLLAAWGLRALWCRLTGRPVMPFVMGMGRGSIFEDMLRRAQQAARPSATPRADAVVPRGQRFADVTDVEPKQGKL